MVSKTIEISASLIESVKIKIIKKKKGRYLIMTTITRAQDFYIVDVQPMVGLVEPRQAKNTLQSNSMILT